MDKVLNFDFERERERGIDFYYRSAKPLLRDSTHVKISLFYDKGGTNFFTGNANPRGFSVSVSIVERKNSCESFILGSGYRHCLKETKRYAAKWLPELRDEAIAKGKEILEMKQSEFFAPDHRPLSVIAQEIRRTWDNIYFGAAPYLDALAQLNSIDDKFGYDDAASIVRYFLSNAQTWRGDDARRIKAELKALI